MKEPGRLPAGCAAFVLAAGKGTRMHSSKPKVLQTILGTPMLAYVLHALAPLFGQDIYVIAGYGADQVRQSFSDAHMVLQPEQKGTGHALQCARNQWLNYSSLLVVNGDTPLISAAWLADFIGRAQGADIAFATITLPDAASYGRVIRKNGQLQAIVEARDYDPARHGANTGEINTGVWWLDSASLDRLLPKLDCANKSGEYYLTDLVRLGLAEGLDVRAVQCGEDMALLGVNTPAELASLEERLQRQISSEFMDSGVIMHAPGLIRIGPRVTIAPGVELSGPCEIFGESSIEKGARVDCCCVIENSRIGAGAHIRSFSHLSGAEVAQGCVVGPYARLRPGAIMRENAHVGNFVELKKTDLGAGAKANHLSYLGDAVIGAGTNIGAGTITCNYDGHEKFPTTIGANAFIGSNTALVAPVNVGSNSLVGAGSVITHDVPDNELAIGRSRQKNLRRRKI